MFIIGKIILTSPTVEECKEVMCQLKRGHHIVLNKSSPDSLLTLLTDMNECLVENLEIVNTPLDSHCVTQLVQVMTYNKTLKFLYLNSSPLLPNTHQLLTKAISSNSTLETLRFYNDKNIRDKDIPYICDIITKNTTLKHLSFYNCPNITKFGIRQIQNMLDNNNTLSLLLINGNYLRFW